MTRRRDFLKTLVVGGGMAATGSGVEALLGFNVATSQEVPSLPDPQTNAFSPEILLNSRLSYHSFSGGTLSSQVLSNVLWATGQAPVIGASRTIYVALSSGVYQYDEQSHTLTLHKTGDYLSASSSSFEIAVASELVEDAGAALHYGHLAVQAFWGQGERPGCCTKESCSNAANRDWDPVASVHMGNCYGLAGGNDEITGEVAAVASDDSLPAPTVDGTTLFEAVLENLNLTPRFSPNDLTPEQISQIVWAAYGCTPHDTTNGRAGLTVASAVANYYLAGRIYVLTSDGVGRFHCRDSSGDNATRDHRLETVSQTDVRQDLQGIVSSLPTTAPVHIVFCAYEDSRWSQIEAGFCGASALLQATAIDLGASLHAGLTSAERNGIQDLLGTQADSVPLLICSVGRPAGSDDTESASDTESDTGSESSSPSDTQAEASDTDVPSTADEGSDTEEVVTESSDAETGGDFESAGGSDSDADSDGESDLDEDADSDEGSDGESDAESENDAVSQDGSDREANNDDKEGVSRSTDDDEDSQGESEGGGAETKGRSDDDNDTSRGSEQGDGIDLADADGGSEKGDESSCSCQVVGRKPAGIIDIIKGVLK